MFHKQNARQPLAAALLALLLALTSAFSCIGLSGWASFRRQLAALDAQYTTVAYSMNNRSPIAYNYMPVEEYEDGSQLFLDGVIWASPERVERLVKNAPGVLRRDANVLTAAHTPNQKGMSSGAADPLTYAAVYDEGRYAQTVAAMRCLEVVENPNFNWAWQEYYFFWFEWIDPVCRIDAYDLPEHSTIFMVKCNQRMCVDEEGNPRPPFEEGKTYLMRGNFVDFDSEYWMRRVEATEDEPEHMENYWYRHTQDYVASLTGMDPNQDPASHRNDFPWQEFDMFLPLRGEDGASLSQDSISHPYPLTANFYLDATELSEENNSLGLTWAASVPEDSWPLFTEYEGDWRDFLDTEEGRVWRDEIIPNCELNHNSVPVLFTDNVQSLSQFCQEESALLEGRFITQEEYDRGDAVCMVSADYALYNGLQVGDTLTLELYKPAYATSSGYFQMMATYTYFYYTYCMPLAESNRLNITKDYTIVGLYTAPVRPMDPDGHGFRGDTVLAPKASAPEVVNAAEEDNVTPLLNTLVLKNGSIEEFETYMAENGAANRFRYYDYGYSEMKESVEAMEDSALRLALLGGAAFLIGAAVFLLASFARMSPSARGLRLLGASPRKVTGEMLSALLPLMAAGVLAGGILGGLLYGKVCEAVLSQTLAPDWPGLAVCAALQLAALGAVAAVWAALTARRGLMRRKQE
ncbi:MAG: hypothetical protein HDT33_00140 [Clostridiales bacterium]|nr:hypothetical protein [Clostridiales bacterium]